MTPSELRRQYLNIAVLTQNHTPSHGMTTVGEYTRIAVRKYRNASINGRGDIKNQVVGFMRRGDYSHDDRIATARAFSGKASVSQYNIALSAIWASGYAGHDLQEFCDNYLGMDCSGFVNNYFHRAHHLTPRRIDDYYSRGVPRMRTEFNQFRQNDVLIWCNSQGTMNTAGHGRHIAVIDHVGATADTEQIAKVVESSGTVGLVESNYRFTKTRRDGIFSVFRPLKPSTRNHVKVVPVL